MHNCGVKKISTTNAIISCKILVKIGPVVSAENRLTDGNCVVVRRILSICTDFTALIINKRA